VLLSIILAPGGTSADQFPFLTAIAVAVAEELMELYEHWQVQIKWPNDIIVNDKKAGGILIENVWKGGCWSASVVGLGLNVLQEQFPSSLPNAISLKQASGRDFDVHELALALRERIIRYTSGGETRDELFRRYNLYLYRQSHPQAFESDGQTWEARVVGVNREGLLELQLADGSIQRFSHGSLIWKW